MDATSSIWGQGFEGRTSSNSREKGVVDGFVLKDIYIQLPGTDSTPTHDAWQEFEYVFLSAPQTGLYSWVQIQFALP